MVVGLGVETRVAKGVTSYLYVVCLSVASKLLPFLRDDGILWPKKQLAHCTVLFHVVSHLHRFHVRRDAAHVDDSAKDWRVVRVGEKGGAGKMCVQVEV
jgi:hypothetical protein